MRGTGCRAGDQPPRPPGGVIPGLTSAAVSVARIAAAGVSSVTSAGSDISLRRPSGHAHDQVPARSRKEAEASTCQAALSAGTSTMPRSSAPGITYGVSDMMRSSYMKQGCRRGATRIACRRSAAGWCCARGRRPARGSRSYIGLTYSRRRHLESLSLVPLRRVAFASRGCPLQFLALVVELG